jgi:hypothetical protein
LRLEIAEGRAGIDQLTREWHELTAALPNRNYVHLWEWQHAYLSTLAPSSNGLIYAAVYEKDRCQAIAPLEPRTFAAAGVSLTALALPTHDHVPYGDLVVHPDFLPRLSLSWLIRNLATHGPAFDVLMLDPVLADSAAAAILRANKPALGIAELAGSSDALATIPYETLLENLSKNFRGNLRKARNKLEKHGDRVRMVSATTPAELRAAFDGFLEVEASGWKGQAGTGTAIALDPALRAFYGRLIDELGPTGACAIHLLLLDGRPIAGQFATLSGDRCYLLKIGYDETHAALAPGNLLLERLLEKYQGHATVKYVDLVTDAGWHASWKPEARPLLRQLIFRPTTRGLLAWTALQGKPPLRKLRTGLRSGWRNVMAAMRGFPWSGF